MKKYLFSPRMHLILFITGLLLIELSFSTLLFAAAQPVTDMGNGAIIKINNSLSILENTDRIETISTANGTIIE